MKRCEVSERTANAVRLYAKYQELCEDAYDCIKELYGADRADEIMDGAHWQCLSSLGENIMEAVRFSVEDRLTDRDNIMSERTLI